ncbi:MAG: glycosyltransferase family 9 protein [Bdellovibrionales bacterium]
MKPLIFKKVLMVRMDRIGDLILTLPVDQLSGFKNSDITWLIQRGMEFLPENSSPKRKYVSWDRRFYFRSAWTLFQFLRRERFDAAIFFHAPWWLSAVCMLAGIHFRAGVRSQWHSYIFLSRGIRQKRSHAKYHESEYNKRLVQQALRWDTKESVGSPLKVNYPVDYSRLKTLGLEENYIVVHPGMAGSARNWTVPLYAEFIEDLAKKDQIVVTASPSDQPWVEQIKEKVQHSNVKWSVITDAKDWLNVLAASRAVIAPSTGTIHVAASLGVPCLGIYSPVRVQAPKRWGPLGANVGIIVPDVECPGHMKCLMESCPRFDCMRDITVEEVKAGLSKIMG